MIDLISQSAVYALGTPSDEGRGTITEQAQGVHTLLHLEDDETAAIGAWLERKCSELMKMNHVHTQVEYDTLRHLSGEAKTVVMLWAYDPDAVARNEEVQKAHRIMHGLEKTANAD